MDEKLGKIGGGRAILALALAALLFLSFGCAALGSEKQKRDVWVMGWTSLLGPALVAVLALLSIGYMAAVLLGDEKLKAWVKKEIAQVFFSLIIFVLAILLVDSLDIALKTSSVAFVTNDFHTYVEKVACCDGSQGPCPAGERIKACHIEIANDHLQFLYETLRENAVTYLSNYWLYAFFSHMGVTIEPLLDIQGATLSVTPLAFLSMGADFFSIMFDLTLKNMMLVRAQQIFLDYVWYAFFPLFLSMGLLLRIFYFTRKLGGLLVALALSMYIVFPMFYVVSSTILFNFTGGWTDFGWEPFSHTYDQSKTPLPATHENEKVDPGAVKDSNKALVVGGEYEEGKTINIEICKEGAEWEEAQPDMNLISESITRSWNLYKYTNWFKQVKEFIGLRMFDSKGPVAVLGMIMVFTLFMPFLGLMTTLAAVKAFSPLIGGDVEISVLSRLI